MNCHWHRDHLFRQLFLPISKTEQVVLWSRCGCLYVCSWHNRRNWFNVSCPIRVRLQPESMMPYAGDDTNKASSTTAAPWALSRSGLPPLEDPLPLLKTVACPVANLAACSTARSLLQVSDFSRELFLHHIGLCKTPGLLQFRDL